MRLVSKTNPAKFQWNLLIFNAASSTLKFMLFGVEVSIVLQIENRDVTPYIERLWVIRGEARELGQICKRNFERV